MRLTDISVIKDLMRRHGFAFSKSLGQNFLVNPSVCPKMADGLSGTVVEIGAGVGVLTRELAKTADKVILIEIDETLKPVLAETLADCGNVSVIWGDVTDPDVIERLRETVGNESVSVAANLPYYVATHIIMRLFELNYSGSLCIDSITVMVQQEVAQRFTAAPDSKQYGIVSVAAGFYSDAKTLFKVSRGSFIPSPNVDSAVVRFELPLVNKYDVDEKAFFRLVKAAFSERRKQVCNPVSKEYNIPKSVLQAMLSVPTARAENLSVNDFIELYEKISACIN